MKKRLFPLTTGGGGGGGHQPTLIDKNIAANGIYVAAGDLADGYSSVTVAVPEPILKTKSITENGSYAASGDDADGFSNVVVNVQTSQPDLISKSITENGYYEASEDSVDGYSDVTVAVPENFEKYHIVATEVGDVVNLAITDYVDQLTDNYYVGTINAEGMQYLYILTENGEPVVLIPKTISANGSYLPASDNASGYSSVTVAVPIPSPALDTKTITTNGTYTAQDDSLDGYSEVVVDVPAPQPALGTKTITADGTYVAQDDSLDGYSSVTVNIEGANDTKLKPLLDATQSASNLFKSYTGTSADTLIAYKDTENVRVFTYMFQECYFLTSIPALNTSKATNMTYMFQSCQAITTVPNMVTSGVINMKGMFDYCINLEVVPALDLSGISQPLFMISFNSCRNLKEIHATGMKYSFDISQSTNFTETALVEIIGNLATVQTTETLRIGSTNLAKLTQAEIDVATNKGWTLA